MELSIFPKCLPHRLLFLAERAGHEFLTMVAFISPKKPLCVIIEAIINAYWECWILVLNNKTINQWSIMSHAKNYLAQQKAGRRKRERQKEEEFNRETVNQTEKEVGKITFPLVKIK